MVCHGKEKGSVKVEGFILRRVRHSIERFVVDLHDVWARLRVRSIRRVRTASRETICSGGQAVSEFALCCGPQTELPLIEDAAVPELSPKVT